MEEHKYSQMDSFSDHDLDCIIDMIVEVEEIKANDGIMKLVKERAKKRMGKMNSIEDLKSAYQAKIDEQNNMEVSSDSGKQDKKAQG